MTSVFKLNTVPYAITSQIIAGKKRKSKAKTRIPSMSCHGKSGCTILQAGYIKFLREAHGWGMSYIHEWMLAKGEAVTFCTVRNVCMGYTRLHAPSVTPPWYRPGLDPTRPSQQSHEKLA